MQLGKRKKKSQKHKQKNKKKMENEKKFNILVLYDSSFLSFRSCKQHFNKNIFCDKFHLFKKKIIKIQQMIVSVSWKKNIFFFFCKDRIRPSKCTKCDLFASEWKISEMCSEASFFITLINQIEKYIHTIQTKQTIMETIQMLPKKSAEKLQTIVFNFCLPFFFLLVSFNRSDFIFSFFQNPIPLELDFPLISTWDFSMFC